MHWLMLALAIFFEVCGTTCLKLSDGFSRLIPSIMIFVFYGLSFTAAALAVKHLDISYFYAIWAALGVLLITVIGVIYFEEPLTAMKIVSIILIVAGVSGLHFSGASH
ncbi:MAG: multidrug efflux SMR transporter [Dehalococcoidia bacterium]